MCNADSFGPVCQLWFVNYKCMHDSKPQHNSLKVPGSAKNRDKHINEASKQTFANNLIKISRKHPQSMLPNWKFCFIAFNSKTYHKFLWNLSKRIKVYRKRPVLTSQFDVSKLQKQLRSIIQTHFDQCANFGPLSTNACDSKPQHKLLRVTRRATNRHKQINETSKHCFATISSNIHIITRKVGSPNGSFVSMFSMNKLRTNLL